MKTCCTTPINKKFDLVRAKEELANYLAHGPKKNTLPLLKAVAPIDLSGATALDIGGGVGAILFQLLGQGVSKAESVDISEAYCAVLQEELNKRQLDSQIRIWNGDFLCLKDDLPNTDIVTLDKVICCYEHFKDLVLHSLNKTKKWYVYSLPRDVWWVKLAHFLKEYRVRNRPECFRSFIHPVHAIESLIEQQGFQKHWQGTRAQWLYTIYRRV